LSVFVGNCVEYKRKNDMTYTKFAVLKVSLDTQFEKNAKEIFVKTKPIPLQAWTGPEGSRRLRLLNFKTIDK